MWCERDGITEEATATIGLSSIVGSKWSCSQSFCDRWSILCSVVRALLYACECYCTPVWLMASQKKKKKFICTNSRIEQLCAGDWTTTENCWWFWRRGGGEGGSGMQKEGGKGNDTHAVIWLALCDHTKYHFVKHDYRFLIQYIYILYIKNRSTLWCTFASSFNFIQLHRMLIFFLKQLIDILISIWSDDGRF